jgi:pilus assembly protein Flp/PilA
MTNHRVRRLQRQRRELPQMRSLFLSFTRDQSGATAIEYGLIAGLIAVVIISTVAVIAKNRLQ